MNYLCRIMQFGTCYGQHINWKHVSSWQKHNECTGQVTNQMALHAILSVSITPLIKQWEVL